MPAYRFIIVLFLPASPIYHYPTDDGNDGPNSRNGHRSHVLSSHIRPQPSNQASARKVYRYNPYPAPATITRIPLSANVLHTDTILESKNWASSIPTTSTSPVNNKILPEFSTAYNESYSRHAIPHLHPNNAHRFSV